MLIYVVHNIFDTIQMNTQPTMWTTQWQIVLPIKSITRSKDSNELICDLFICWNVEFLMHLFCFCVWFFFIYISYLFFVIFLKLYVGAVTSFVDFFPCLVIAHVLNPWRIWIQKEAYLNQRNAKQYVFVRV